MKRPNTFIARDGLVTDALKKTRRGRILVVGSPPGTGKTSLSQLMLEKLCVEKEESQKRIKGFYLRPTNSPDDLFQHVEDKTGISFRNQELRKDLKGFSEVWLLFDGAQMLCDETKCGAFWDCIVKQKRQFGDSFWGDSRLCCCVRYMLPVWFAQLATLFHRPRTSKCQQFTFYER